MSAMLKSFRKAKSEEASAVSYVGLLGRVSPGATARHSGTLASLVVKTRMHFQEYDGAKNYHENPVFDEALARVISRNFKTLAADALALMAQNTAQAASMAKANALELLSEIDKSIKDCVPPLPGGQAMSTTCCPHCGAYSRRSCEWESMTGCPPESAPCEFDEWDAEPDPDRLREDRDERRRLEKEDRT